MQLIVLTGLVVVEKATLALELAQYHHHEGRTTHIIDNMVRLPIAAEHATGDDITITRLQGDLTHYLHDALDHIDAHTVILAVAETAHPDALFTLLDDVQYRRDDVQHMRTLALVDTRTCDCFPHVRDALETYADAVIMLPSTFDEVIGAL